MAESFAASAQAKEKSALNILSVAFANAVIDGGVRCMSNLSSDELDEIRAMFSGMNLSGDKQDEFIRILDNFAMASADKAHGLSSIQISLAATANYSFDGVGVSAKMRRSRKIERKALHDEGAINNPSSKEPGAR